MHACDDATSGDVPQRSDSPAFFFSPRMSPHTQTHARTHASPRLEDEADENLLHVRPHRCPTFSPSTCANKPTDQSDWVRAGKSPEVVPVSGNRATFSSSPPLKRLRSFEESVSLLLYTECAWKWGSLKASGFSTPPLAHSQTRHQWFSD